MTREGKRREEVPFRIATRNSYFFPFDFLKWVGGSTCLFCFFFGSIFFSPIPTTYMDKYLSFLVATVQVVGNLLADRTRAGTVLAAITRSFDAHLAGLEINNLNGL